MHIMDIADRIKIIIQQKAKNQKEFAEMMGWSQTYVSKISTQQKPGLTPIMQILEKFKDIDARWLLFGEGYIFGSIEQGILRRITFLLDIERYIPVMSERELQAYLDAIQGRNETLFSDEVIKKWQELLSEKNRDRDARIYEAMRKNNELVNLKKEKEG